MDHCAVLLASSFPSLMFLQYRLSSFISVRPDLVSTSLSHNASSTTVLNPQHKLLKDRSVLFAQPQDRNFSLASSLSQCVPPNLHLITVVSGNVRLCEVAKIDYLSKLSRRNPLTNSDKRTGSVIRDCHNTTHSADFIIQHV